MSVKRDCFFGRFGTSCRVPASKALRDARKSAVGCCTGETMVGNEMRYALLFVAAAISGVVPPALGQVVQSGRKATEFPQATLACKVKMGTITEREVGSPSGTKCDATCKVISTLKGEVGNEVQITFRRNANQKALALARRRKRKSKTCLPTSRPESNLRKELQSNLGCAERKSAKSTLRMSCCFAGWKVDSSTASRRLHKGASSHGSSSRGSQNKIGLEHSTTWNSSILLKASTSRYTRSLLRQSPASESS